MLVDKIISARWLIPVKPENKVLEQYSVVINDGVILEILPKSEAFKKYKPCLVVERNNHALMPGLVNAHTHTPMVLLRGIGDALPLKNWLEDCIWPAESELISDKFIADGTRLGIAEMLLNGTTCFSEHYFRFEVAAEVVAETGVRALIGIGVNDNQLSYDFTSFTKSINPMYRYSLALHSPYMLGDNSLSKIVEACAENPLPIHIHLHETAFEIENSIKQYQKRPIARLKDLGLFSQHLIAVHMVHLDRSDLEIMQANKCHVVTCPDSNLKLGSGICNIDAMRAIGINVAIGTDGAASNNDLDLLAEAKNAALLNRFTNSNSLLSQASEVISMLTINGAKALGFEDNIGSLEPGKAADIIAIDNMQNIHESQVMDQIVFAKNGRSVSDVWVNGEQLVSSYELTKIDFDQLICTAESWQSKTKKFNGPVETL